MLVDATLNDLLHITYRLRPLDEKEIFALRFDNDPYALAEFLLEQSKPLWVIKNDFTREPVYTCGLRLLRPGVWAIWGCGTPLFPSVAYEVTRLFKRILCPVASDIGHRFECVCLAEKTDTLRWLQMIGLTIEADLLAFGRDREDFKLMVWRA